MRPLNRTTGLALLLAVGTLGLSALAAPPHLREAAHQMVDPLHAFRPSSPVTSASAGQVLLPGNPETAQSQGFDPVFGDYVMVRSVPSGANTLVLGAINLVDAANPANIDPVSVSYTFASSTHNIIGTPTETNMVFNNGVRTHQGACSEMDLAIAPGGGNVFAASNDFGDLNVNALPPPGRSSTPGVPLGSQSSVFTSTNGGATWSSGTNTGGSSGVFVDGVFAPFQVVASGGAAPSGFQPVNAGEGAVNFGTIGANANGTRAGDQWIAIGNLVSALDKNGVCHYVTIAILANDIDPATSVQISAIVHYTLAPGATVPELCNVVVAHASTETANSFEDKPWVAYNPKTDTLYASWTHFNFGTQESSIEVSRLTNASTVVGSNSSATWSAPQRLDNTGLTQGSNLAVDANGNLLVQWQDEDTSNPQDITNTINTAESTNDGVTFSPPVETFTNETAFGLVAVDGRNRIGPFIDVGFEDPSITGLRQNQFPLIAVDPTNSSDELVTVFQQANPNDPGTHNDVVVAGAGGGGGFAEPVQSDSDIFFIRTNQTTGQLVSGPTRVNTDTTQTDQFEPSVTVGQDGAIHVLFLDRSQDPNNVDVGAALAISTDGGSSFTEFTGALLNQITATPTPTPVATTTSTPVATGTTTATLPVTDVGGGGGGGGGCFIATAAYGSYLDPHVNSLRHFRDAVLMPTAPGRQFVSWYYHWSPEAAAYISPRPLLRSLTRLGLTPLVVGVEHPLGVALGLVLGVALWKRRREAQLTVA